MGPVEAFTTAWRKSFTYGGKATRAEYWWFYLVNLIVIIGVYVLMGIAAANGCMLSAHGPAPNLGRITGKGISTLFTVTDAFRPVGLDKVSRHSGSLNNAAPTKLEEQQGDEIAVRSFKRCGPPSRPATNACCHSRNCA